MLNGSFDPRFGLDELPGRATSAVAGLSQVAAMALTPDGGAVLVGTVRRGGNDDFAAVRFGPDGRPDLRFGTAGVAVIPFDLGGPGADSDRARGLAVQPDGRILLVGEVERAGGQRDFGIARLLPDGRPDPDFGEQGGGRVVVGFDRGTIAAHQDDIARAVAVQPDGRIVVVGQVDDVGDRNDFGIIRLDPDGRLDPTFHDGGRLIVSFNLGPTIDLQDDAATAVALAPDGRIVVAGSVDRADRHRDFGVVRVLPSGQLDTSFGEGGRVVVGFDLGSRPSRRHDDPTAVVVTPEGGILVAGTALEDDGRSAFGLLRLDARGAPDSGFGDGGRVVARSGDRAEHLASGLAVQPDGRIVVVGSARRAGGAAQFAAVRLEAAGRPDRSFGADGWVRFSFDPAGPPGSRPLPFADDLARGGAIDADGRLVLAGEAADGRGGIRAAAARIFLDSEPPTIVRLGPIPELRRNELPGPVELRFSEPIREASVTASALRLTRDGREVPLGPAVVVVPRDGSATDFFIEGLASATALSGSYELIVDAAGVRDLAGNPGEGVASASFVVRRRAVPADYDGDGLSDVATFSVVGGVGRFEIRRSSDGAMRIVELGGPGDVPVDGDYDGDGIIDPAVFGIDPETGTSRFLYLRSSDGELRSIPFGGPSAVPLAGDYDGDGRTDLAVFSFDPAEGFGRFRVVLSGTGEAFSRPFGGRFDVPVVGDFDGDGRSDLAVFGFSGQEGVSRFAVLPSGPNDPTFSGAVGAYPVPFGGLGDLPIVGDYDGDGRSDVAVYRTDPVRSISTFVIRPSGGLPERSFPFGGALDLPVVGDYDGDGRSDLAVFGFSRANGFSRFGILPSGGSPARTERFGSIGAIGLPFPARSLAAIGSPSPAGRLGPADRVAAPAVASGADAGASASAAGRDHRPRVRRWAGPGAIPPDGRGPRP